MHEVSVQFSWKNKKNIISLSSAESAHSLGSVQKQEMMFKSIFLMFQIKENEVQQIHIGFCFQRQFQFE